MLHRPSMGSLQAEGQDKENVINPSEKAKTPMSSTTSGLKMRMMEGKGKVVVSPAASPNSKKIRLAQTPGKTITTPAVKALGLKDITNSEIRSRPTTARRVTDSVAPRLLVESKKRSLPSMAHSIAPPSKLHIMNTASQLDFDSMPDSELPEVEVVPTKFEEDDDDDFFEQYDFSFIIEGSPKEEDRSDALLAETRKAFETTQFESELSQLSIDPTETTEKDFNRGRKSEPKGEPEDDTLSVESVLDRGMFDESVLLTPPRTPARVNFFLAPVKSAENRPVYHQPHKIQRFELTPKPAGKPKRVAPWKLSSPCSSIDGNWYPPVRLDREGNREPYDYFVHGMKITGSHKIMFLVSMTRYSARRWVNEERVSLRSQHQYSKRLQHNIKRIKSRK